MFGPRIIIRGSSASIGAIQGMAFPSPISMTTSVELCGSVISFKGRGLPGTRHPSGAVVAR